MVKLAKDDRQFVAIAVAHEYLWDTPRGSHWIGTAPLAALPGDQVFLLPKLESCIVLRSTRRNDEFLVVGCALLPMAQRELQRNITLRDWERNITLRDWQRNPTLRDVQRNLTLRP
jgi:hypothetical protein